MNDSQNEPTTFDFNTSFDTDINLDYKQLLDFFIDGYTAISKHMDSACQDELTQAMPLVFSKWFHTALTADTLLTPANIILQDLKKQAMHKEFSYSLFIDPMAEDDKNYQFTLLEYSTKSHPMLSDVKLIIDYCSPVKEMDDALFFLEEDKQYLQQQLSIQHDFYLEYLTRLIWWMGFLVQLPAIHVRKAQRHDEVCDIFFAQSPNEMLYQLAEGACELAAERFVAIMDLDDDIISSDFFMNCLDSPREVDDIFIDFYNHVDIDISSIWTKVPLELDEEEKTILSSFVFTGIMIDKWFLFPMSNFLHIIKPISFSPIKFHQLVNSLAAMITMGHNISTEIFTPPSYYALTSIGKEVLDADEQEFPKYTMPDTLTFEQILMALEHEYYLRSIEEKFLTHTTKDVLTLHAFKQHDDELWKNLEVEVNCKLDDFCEDLCLVFGIEFEGFQDYILTIPDQNGFPMEFSPLGSKRAINKTAGKTLQTFHLQEKAELLLRAGHDVGHRDTIILQIQKITKGNPFVIYPRIQKQSPQITKLESYDEFF